MTIDESKTQWLAGGLEHEWIIFHFIYGLSSFPLTNSYFSEGLVIHGFPQWDEQRIYPLVMTFTGLPMEAMAHRKFDGWWIFPWQTVNVISKW
jgi:hypothetical protein